MKASNYPTATEIMDGKRGLVNFSPTRSKGMLDRMMQKLATNADRGMTVALLKTLYSDPSFKVRSGFDPDATRVAFSSDGVHRHHILLLMDGRPSAKIEWNYHDERAGSFFARYEWRFDLKIDGRESTQENIDFAALKKGLDRPISKPAEKTADDPGVWDRLFDMTSTDYVTWATLGGASLGIGALTGSALAAFAGAGVATFYTLATKVGFALRTKPTTKAIGLADPMTLYRLMSADIESAQRYADLAQRTARAKSTFEKSGDIDDIAAMTAINRTMPRLIDSCLATLDGLQSEADRRSVLTETAVALEEVLTMAEARLKVREHEAITKHRDVLAGARDYDMATSKPQVLH